jgi:hypothetical protein
MKLWGEGCYVLMMLSEQVQMAVTAEQLTEEQEKEIHMQKIISILLNLLWSTLELLTWSMCASAGATLAPLKVGLKFCMAYVFL